MGDQSVAEQDRHRDGEHDRLGDVGLDQQVVVDDAAIATT